MVRRVSQREDVMAFRSSWFQAMQEGTQRFAAGIDVNSQTVRLVVVSQRSRARAALQYRICEHGAACARRDGGHRDRGSSGGSARVA